MQAYLGVGSDFVRRGAVMGVNEKTNVNRTHRKARGGDRINFFIPSIITDFRAGFQGVKRSL